VAAENGRDYTETQFAAGFGRTSREVIAEQWQGEPLSDEQIAEIDRRKEALFREIISRDFPAMEGAVELIESLVHAGFRVAVGSSGPAENVQLSIEQLRVGRLLSATVTGDDVKRGKPDPQVFLIAAERMRVPPARCVVVEDAPSGVGAGKGAGCRVLAVLGTHPAEELSEADWVVGSLEGLAVRANPDGLELRFLAVD